MAPSFRPSESSETHEDDVQAYQFLHSPEVGGQEQIKTIEDDPEVLVSMQRMAKAHLDHWKALSPKQSELLKPFFPYFKAWDLEMEKAYELKTGQSIDMSNHIISMDAVNAFCVGCVDTTVLSFELILELLREASDDQQNVDISLLKVMYWTVRGHELGHKYLGAFRDDPLFRKSKKAKNITDLSLGTASLKFEIRAFDLSIEVECDRFGVDLMVEAGMDVQHSVRVLDILSRAQRDEDREYHMLKMAIYRANLEYHREHSVKMLEEENLANEMDEENDEEIDRIEMSAHDALYKQKMENSRKVPSLLYTHPETSWRRKLLEEKVLSLRGHQDDTGSGQILPLQIPDRRSEYVLGAEFSPSPSADFPLSKSTPCLKLPNEYRYFINPLLFSTSRAENEGCYFPHNAKLWLSQEAALTYSNVDKTAFEEYVSTVDLRVSSGLVFPALQVSAREDDPAISNAFSVLREHFALYTLMKRLGSTLELESRLQMVQDFLKNKGRYHAQFSDSDKFSLITSLLEISMEGSVLHQEVLRLRDEIDFAGLDFMSDEYFRAMTRLYRELKPHLPTVKELANVMNIIDTATFRRAEYTNRSLEDLALMSQWNQLREKTKESDSYKIDGDFDRSDSSFLNSFSELEEPLFLHWTHLVESTHKSSSIGEIFVKIISDCVPNVDTDRLNRHIQSYAESRLPLGQALLYLCGTYGPDYHVERSTDGQIDMEKLLDDTDFMKFVGVLWKADLLQQEWVKRWEVKAYPRKRVKNFQDEDMKGLIMLETPKIKKLKTYLKQELKTIDDLPRVLEALPVYVDCFGDSPMEEVHYFMKTQVDLLHTYAHAHIAEVLLPLLQSLLKNSLNAHQDAVLIWDYLSVYAPHLHQHVSFLDLYSCLSASTGLSLDLLHSLSKRVPLAQERDVVAGLLEQFFSERITPRPDSWGNTFEEMQLFLSQSPDGEIQSSFVKNFFNRWFHHAVDQGMEMSYLEELYEAQTDRQSALTFFLSLAYLTSDVPFPSETDLDEFHISHIAHPHVLMEAQQEEKEKVIERYTKIFSGSEFPHDLLLIGGDFHDFSPWPYQLCKDFPEFQETVADTLETLLEKNPSPEFRETFAFSLNSFYAGVHMSARSVNISRAVRDSLEQRFGRFDGEKGMILGKVLSSEYPDNLERYRHVESYVDRFVCSAKARQGLKVRFANEYKLQGEDFRDFVRSSEWSFDLREKTAGELLKERLFDAQNALDPATIDGEQQVYVNEPVQQASLLETSQYLDPAYQLMISGYEYCRDEEQYFLGMTAQERLHSLRKEIFPLKGASRDLIFDEQFPNPEELDDASLLMLRDAYSEVRNKDKIALLLQERVAEEGKSPLLRQAFAELPQGQLLLQELGLEQLEGAGEWKKELFEILCLYPSPSFVRDELLEKLANKKPGVQEGDHDLPSTSADMSLLTRWKVDRALLRRDEQATQRMLELESILSGIRQLKRVQRIELLLFYMGIDIDNEAKRMIERKIRRKVPGFSIEGSRLSQREMDQMLLELFEGKTSGIFVGQNEFDNGSSERFLKEISQRVVNKGNEKTQLQMGNLIYRIFQSAHWKKRLRITQEIFQFSQREDVTEEEFVKHFICSLGASFVKGAQQEGQKPWVPGRFREVLMDVFDNAPLPSKPEMMAVLDREVGLEHFQGVYEPLACASTAVVYRAVLATGEEVAVKVIKPNAIAEMEWDVALIRDLIQFVNGNQDLYGVCLPEMLADEIHDSLLIQMDLRNERENQANYQKAVDQLSSVLSTQANEVSVVQLAGGDHLQNRRVGVYEMVRGIPLTNPRQLRSFAEFMAMEVLELRRSVNMVLAMTQIGCLLKADHIQADPNPGNAMLVTTFSRKASQSVREKCARAIASIRAGRDVEDHLLSREVRMVDVGVKLLDFGAIQEIPPLYREQLHHLFWAVLTGSVDDLQELFYEFHLSTHLEKNEGDISQVPILDLKALEKDLIDLFETFFGNLIEEALDNLEEEDLSRERFGKLLENFAKNCNASQLFQEFMSLMDHHQIHLPNALVAVLKSFRIGSYIFQDLDIQDVLEEVQRVLPKTLIEKMKAKGSSLAQRLMGKKAWGLLKSGVRSFPQLRKAVSENEKQDTPLFEVLLGRLKSAHVDEWFERYKPAERVHKKVSDEQMKAYHARIDAGERPEKDLSADSSVNYQLGITEVEPGLRIDSLGKGTVLKYKVRGEVQTIVLQNQCFLSMTKGSADCLKADGKTSIRIHLPTILRRSLVQISSKWYRGMDLIKIHAPDQEIENHDYSGLTEEVPEGIRRYIESLISEQNTKVTVDILKKRALQDYDEDPVSEDDDEEEDEDDDIDYFS